MLRCTSGCSEAFGRPLAPWPQLPHLQNEKLCLMSPQDSRSRTCACAPGVHPPATLSPGDSRATVSG